MKNVGRAADAGEDGGGGAVSSTEDLSRYSELSVALDTMKQSGQKRRKTVDEARGMAYEIKRELEKRGLKVPEPA